MPEEMEEIPAVCVGLLHSVAHATEKDLQEVEDLDS